MEKYTGLHIADVHIGGFDLHQLIHEWEWFRNYLSSRFFNYIIIEGDLFDRKLYTGDEYELIATDIVEFLLTRCEKLRIVYGTDSHENNQYNIFTRYENNSSSIMEHTKFDFKIIRHVCEEELFPGMNVLYLPEEYIYDKEEYYKDFFSKKKFYDYVFGHGVIQEGMVNATRHMSNSQEKRRRPPVFKTNELESICKGDVLFGHYHENTEITDNVMYIGSFSRYKFNEEKDKGFYITETDLESYTHTFIKNTSTKFYTTLSFPYGHVLFKDGTDLVEYFKNIKKRKIEGKTDYLRLIFNIPTEYDKAEFFINLVGDTFRNEDTIKIEIVNGYIANKKKLSREEVKDVEEEYDFLFDENNSIEDKYHNFIKKRKNVELETSMIKKMLSFKAVDLLKQMEDTNEEDS